jgi:hypothetical protein
MAPAKREHGFVIEDGNRLPAPQEDHVIVIILIGDHRPAAVEENQLGHRAQ